MAIETAVFYHWGECHRSWTTSIGLFDSVLEKLRNQIKEVISATLAETQLNLYFSSMKISPIKTNPTLPFGS
jgi:hypothetical protein